MAGPGGPAARHGRKSSRSMTRRAALTAGRAPTEPGLPRLTSSSPAAELSARRAQAIDRDRKDLAWRSALVIGSDNFRDMRSINSRLWSG